MNARLAAVTAALVLATTAACGAGSSSGGSSSGGSGSPGASSTAGAPSSSGQTSASGHLVVFAAASLKKAFTQIGAQFEKSHPGSTVSFSFAGSSDLVSQLQQGAPADVFASADKANMAKVTADSLTATPPVNFASNTLEIAVPPGNPAHITRFADLAKPGLKLVLCAPAVPCGSAAVKVAKAAGIQLKPVSEEQSVTDVLGKVSAGEADAGLVYVTDIKGDKGAVQGIAFPLSSAAVNVYPIAPLKASKNAALAQAFVDAVTGAPGQGILAAAGFAKAP